MSNYIEKRIRPAISYYGGKTLLSRRILQLAPPHRVYVECFAGGLSVLLNKYRSEVEVACDVNEELVNFYRVFQERSEDIIERVKETKCDKLTFYAAKEAGNSGDEFTRAMNFLIRHNMSFSGIGATWADGGGREFSWETLPYDLRITANRLKGVKILFRSAFDVIPEYDSVDTWMYIDPPYYSSTRVSAKVYNKELNEMDHLRFLKLLNTLKSSVVLSGYNHPMYQKELAHWDRVEIEVLAFSSIKKNTQRSKRTEVLWVKQQPF